MSDQIIFNDERLELSPNTIIALTSQINNLSDLKDHRSTLSNTIKVPPTSHNLHVLGNSDRVQSETLIPYRKNRVRVIKQGVNVIKNGVGTVNEVSKEVGVVVYEGNIDLFSAIEGKTLRDLDLSALSHVFDYAGVTGSFTNDYTDGYKYSLIDYGKMSATTRVVKIFDLKPTVFASYLFKKILEEAGFEYEGEIFSDENFNKLLITTENDNVGTYFDENELITTGDTVLYTYPDTQDATDFNATIKLAANTHYQYEITLKFTISGWVNGSSYFYIQNVVPHQATLDTLYSHSDADGSGTFTKTITFNTLSYSIVRDWIIGLSEMHGLCTLTVIFGEVKASVIGSSGDVFNLAILPIAARTASTTDSYNANFGFELKNVYGFTTINVSRILPDWTQKEFLKSIGHLFHLMFSTNIVDKKIRFKQFKEIVADYPNALDWTTKVDMKSFNAALGFKIDGYAQSNKCTYKEDDNDNKPKEFGNGIILVDDENLQTERTVIDLPFSSTLMSTRLVAYFVPIIKRTDEDGNYTIDNVPRILIDDTGSTWDTTNIGFDDEVNTLLEINSGVPFCYFILGEKDFNLGFNNSILKDNYSALTQVLNKSKKIQVWMKLTAVDFYNLDHFKPIYLSQYSAYFYINKVINYTGEGLTKVELIRIGIRNQSLLGMRVRYKSDYGEGLYGQINRIWQDGTHTFIIRHMVLNGVEYGSNQTLDVIAPGDLLAGIGIDGNAYIMNLSDWVTSLMPDGFEMKDNGLCFNVPADATFFIEIEYIDGASGFSSNIYQYKNKGFYINGSLYREYTKEAL